jgi:membrane-bound lytic murein transglycosylase A
MTFMCQPCRFDDLDGWQDDDHKAAFAAFVVSANHHINQKPYPTRAISISQQHFSEICNQAIQLSEGQDITTAQAKIFFEENFTPHFIDDAGKSGFVTAYYEPEVRVSFIKDSEFQYPIYRQPEDLKSIKHLTIKPNTVPKNFDFARQVDDGYEVYSDRKAIDCGCLESKGLEIAYAAERSDVYFIHIQGSAKLIDDHGQTMRVSYAAKTGHPYTSIGKILVERGIISQEHISMEAIRSWIAEDMKENPYRVDEILWQNQSYIFFSQNSQLEDNLGPVGAAKVQLTPRRSLAVDRSIHQFGLPIFINMQTDLLEDGDRFRRLMIAQDTGSAILGASRGDIFMGSGEDAGQIAGKVCHDAEFYILLPKN